MWTSKHYLLVNHHLIDGDALIVPIPNQSNTDSRFFYWRIAANASATDYTNSLKPDTHPFVRKILRSWMPVQKQSMNDINLLLNFQMMKYNNCNTGMIKYDVMC